MTRTSPRAASGSRRVEAEGGSLYVECHGQGPPVLLVHGWSLDHRSFAPQIAALSDRFRVIAYDRRGFGRSSAPPDLHRELDDIDRILDALGIDSVHIVGVSQGGRVALRYAVTRGERLRSLVLQGTMVDGIAAADVGADRIPLDEYAGLARAGRLDELQSRWLAHPMMRLRGPGDEAGELLADIVGDYEARDLVDFDPSSYEFDVDPLAAIASFDKPLLLVTGAGETAARKEHARQLVARAPMAREIIMPASGHLANLEESEAFNDALAAFIGDAERRSR